MPNYIDFRLLKIKEFEFWNLQLHQNQFPYIGRCYAWCKRDNAKSALDMNEKENAELFSKIIPSWWNAVKALYDSERPNISCYGNEAPHLHWHLIPRFSGKRMFYSITFEDRNQKSNYAPYEKKEISLDMLIKIKNDITSKLK
jgi:diadenosine tetraphosphate (Ap4A) HIT family hydrolase